MTEKLQLKNKRGLKEDQKKNYPANGKLISEYIYRHVMYFYIKEGFQIHMKSVSDTLLPILDINELL